MLPAIFFLSDSDHALKSITCMNLYWECLDLNLMVQHILQNTSRDCQMKASVAKTCRFFLTTVAN